FNRQIQGSVVSLQPKDPCSEQPSKDVSKPTIEKPKIMKVKSDAQKKTLHNYLDREVQYQKTFDTQQRRHLELAQEKKQEISLYNNLRHLRQQNKSELIFGKGYSHGLKGHNGILYPKDKKRKLHQTTRFSYEACLAEANNEEILAPIRLDIEHDGYKVRDTFTWNMNGKTKLSVTTDQFAEITCEDLRLPTSTFAPLISASIKEQIEDFVSSTSTMVTENDNLEAAVSFKDLLKNKEEDKSALEYQTNEKSKDLINKNPELRTVIRLNILVGNRMLNDQFEWDVSCPKNSPETFAEAMSTDLGLCGEFKTAIAHSIREQVHVYLKSLLLTGYEFGDEFVKNDDLKQSFLPTVNSVIRDIQSMEHFTPTLLEMTDTDISKIEKIRTRESRQRKRGVRNRKGVTVLPNREPIPTYRTGFALPFEHEMADENGNDPTLHSQRKSAMKARANMSSYLTNPDY
ncbi:SWI/SNF chromatin-remodeling complex subunit, partial [Rhizopus stolonifer]